MLSISPAEFMFTGISNSHLKPFSLPKIGNEKEIRGRPSRFLSSPTSCHVSRAFTAGRVSSYELREPTDTKRPISFGFIDPRYKVSNCLPQLTLQDIDKHRFHPAVLR